MALNYTVKQGDCISSIAYEHGFFPDTIWNHPQNKQLKDKRKDPNVLMPGDVVFVPDKRVKEVSEATDQVHKYRVKNVPAKFHLRLLFDGEPRKDEPYDLILDGKTISGNTDSDGNIKLSIPPNAKSGKLIIGTGEKRMEYPLGLGRMDPVDEVIGVQKRLENLGYDVGPLDGELNEKTVEALQAFQSYSGITISGELDEQTKAKLKETHDQV